MQIQITYEDGAAETLDVRLVGGIVAVGHRWLPGHVVAEPTEPCPVASDWFAAAIDEGGLREGVFREPGERGFSWRLLGTPAEECRAKLRAWGTLLGADLDPNASGRNLMLEGTLRRLDDAQATRFDTDMQCCLAFLDDPEEEAAAVLVELGYRRAEPASP